MHVNIVLPSSAGDPTHTLIHSTAEVGFLCSACYTQEQSESIWEQSVSTHAGLPERESASSTAVSTSLQQTSLPSKENNKGNAGMGIKEMKPAVQGKQG